MLATTIDDVIDALDAIVRESRRDRVRFGYFAALYRRVTIEVKHRAAAGYFEDNDQMRLLDVIFANRYFEAIELYRRGQRPTESWRIAFDSAYRSQLRILQHLLLGINAHIGLDLGVAVVDLVDGSGLTEPLHRDYDRLNGLLAELVDEVQTQIAHVSPLLGILDRLAGQWDEQMVNKGIVMARDGAWRVAEELVVLPLEERPAAIARRDRTVAAFGNTLARPRASFNPFWRLACVGESRSIPRVLDAMKAAAQT
jgi:hypothetical protein